MFQLRHIIVQNRSILSILVFYFCLHLFNLTTLPIFNDESIYLDWAWNHTHMPGHLYDSLLDAKQPLLIWIFAISENIFADPLLAGRVVSVIFGSFTLLGVYVIAKKLFNKKVALISASFFVVIPIFVFYNRQALMEASVACIGLWSFNALYELIIQRSDRRALILGLLLGIGYLIKSSSLLFMIPSLLAILFLIYKERKVEIIRLLLITVGSIVAVNFLIIINPVFWQTLSTNSRYSYTLREIAAFPLSGWVNNITGLINIGFFFVTPLVFFMSIGGFSALLKSGKRKYLLFLSYFSGALLLQIIFVRFQGQRYLVPYLPFLIISASFASYKLWENSSFKKMIVVAAFMIPLACSLLLIFYPEKYILQLARVTNSSETGYVLGQTSGHDVNKVMLHIKERSRNNSTMVLFGLNIGNPESAIDLYSIKDPNLYALHIDSQMIPGVNQYDCLSSKYPAYFVTRENQLLGMENFFLLEKIFLNPDGKYYISIYKLNEDCVGKTLSLSDLYQPAIEMIDIIRN